MPTTLIYTLKCPYLTDHCSMSGKALGIWSRIMELLLVHSLCLIYPIGDIFREFAIFVMQISAWCYLFRGNKKESRWLTLFTVHASFQIWVCPGMVDETAIRPVFRHPINIPRIAIVLEAIQIRCVGVLFPCTSRSPIDITMVTAHDITFVKRGFCHKVVTRDGVGPYYQIGPALAAGA